MYVPIRAGVRSLNLANVVCLATYVALSSSGMTLPDNDGTYTPPPAQAAPVRPADIVRRR